MDDIAEAKRLLQKVYDEYEDTGCEFCGTIGVGLLNEIATFLGEPELEEGEGYREGYEENG